jgi:thiamine biosynthesis lipoprotein ApbE
MPRPVRITFFLLSLWHCGAGARSAPAADDFAFYHENVMGTSLELRVRAVGEEAARWAEDRVLREIDRLGAIFSGYDASSEFSRWQATSEVPRKISAELFEILQASDQWRARSGGAFDPRVQALTMLWSRCARQDRTPTPDELAGAKALMGRPAWRLDVDSRTAERLSDCPLSLNAIAKGYIVERACDAALDRGRGVLGLLLNVGGDLRACGDDARTIGIVSPFADSEASEPLTRIEVRDRAVATSGNSQRGLSINGKWYSHIFDPRTGAPAPSIAGATVIAERSADADALATILNVLEPEEGLRLVRTLPGAECLIVAADGRIARSDGWQRYEKARPTSPALALADGPRTADAKTDQVAPKTSSQPSWGDEFELVVNYEINRPDAEGGRYRRPFVAVWVEDKNGVPVRNLVLWVSLGGPGPWEWIKDMRRWYRSDQLRKRDDPKKTDMVLTVSRPTRPPGKYSVIWDGKDDHGKPLERGEYTLYIDAAREHGTYHGLRKEVRIADTPFRAEFEGEGIEIKSASLEYRRKASAK